MLLLFQWSSSWRQSSPSTRSGQVRSAVALSACPNAESHEEGGHLPDSTGHVPGAGQPPVLLKPIPQGEDGAGSALGIPQCGEVLVQVIKVPSHPDFLLSTRLKVSSQAEADGWICLFLGWREDLNMSFLCITRPGKAQAVL